MSEFRKIGDGLGGKKILEGLHPVDKEPGEKLPFGCSKCDGYGNIVDEKGARPCQCKLDYFRKKRLGKANIPPHFQRMSLESFQRKTRAQKNVYSTVNLYVQRYSSQNSKGLLLWGGPGCGKTHLAVGVLQELIKKGHDGVFYNSQELLRQIRRSFDPRSPESDPTIIQQDLDREILLLDDFGGNRITGWVADEIYSIINSRYQANKTLIITTQDFDALAERIGESVYSRLLEMCVIKHCGEDDYRETHLAETLDVDDIA